MKNVPAMRTSDSSAVLGSLRVIPATGWVLLIGTDVVFSTVTFPSVLLSREQRFSGCSLKI